MKVQSSIGVDAHSPSPQGRVASEGEPGGVLTRITRTGRPLSRLPVGLGRHLRQSATPGERRLWAELRDLRAQGLHFRRQVAIGTFVVDFACLRRKLVIEIDGSQHNNDAHAERDRLRDAELQSSGFNVLRFWNTDVSSNLGTVLDTICAYAGVTPRPGPADRPSPEGRVAHERDYGGSGLLESAR